MTRRRLIFFAALMAVFSGSVLAWTQTSTSFQLTILPYNADGGENAGKRVINHEPIGETFYILKGAAQIIRGLELYKIELASKDDCVEVQFDLSLQNGYDMGRILSNSKAFIDVGVWYPDPENLSDVVLNGGVDNGTRVKRDDGEGASGMLSGQEGTVTLVPSKTVTSTLYILASIMVPANPSWKPPNAPPGQQDQLFDLELGIRVSE